MKEHFIKSINKHQNIIYKICRLYRNSPEDQEDLFQEIVYQLWKSYPKFKGESKISTWLYRIASNEIKKSFSMVPIISPVSNELKDAEIIEVLKS